MMVYRGQRETAATADLLPEAFGEVEAAIADELSPECDSDHPRLAAMRCAALGLGPVPKDLPPTITVSVPEGYAYYALYPDAYRDAARAFHEARRPEVAVVIGIRSIGTSLSAEVGRELLARGSQVHSWTVRPRGHPFDRRLVIDAGLAARWRELAHAHFAIVDEGPGLSGSSFAAVAECLTELGVPTERMAFFPAWAPDGSGFVSEHARRIWRQHEKYVGVSRAFDRFADAREISAGAWREVAGQWPAVHPQHERRKFLRDGVLYKFAGLGRFGARVAERARALADAGFGPAVEGFENGFLATRFSSVPPRFSAASVARYLAFVRRGFPVKRTPEPLDEMIRLNVEEGLGMTAPPLGAPEPQPVALDARIFPHEWSGDLKTDGAEHHDDHFYPGPHDIAWDLAAAQIELDLDPVPCYQKLTGESVAAKLPYYRLAWLAFRLGYATLAGDIDGGRWHAQRERYARLLRWEIWTTSGR